MDGTLLTSSGVMVKVQLALDTLEHQVEGNWDGGTSQFNLSILNGAAEQVIAEMSRYRLERAIRADTAEIEKRVRHRAAAEEELRGLKGAE